MGEIKKSGLKTFRNKNFGKSAQVTIFIIVAILIVFSIFIYFFYVSPKIEKSSSQKLQIEKCIEKELNKKITELGLTAGIKNPKFTTMYLDENYTFICYTGEYYKPCSVQHPFLVESFEKALMDSTKSQIQTCYNNAVNELKAQGYEVTSGTIKSNITLSSDLIKVRIDAPTTFSQGESSSSLSKIDINIKSDLYNVITIANSILQFESSYGDSEISGFMFYYPDIFIQKIRRDDSVKLYIITDKKDIKYRFAVRSYAWPAGYDNGIN